MAEKNLVRDINEDMKSFSQSQKH